MSNKGNQNPSLVPNLGHGTLEPDMYAGMDDNELIETLKQQLQQEQIKEDDEDNDDEQKDEEQGEELQQPSRTRGRSRRKRQAAVLETDEGKSLKDAILKLKKYSKSFNYDERSVFKAKIDFRDKNLTFDAISQSVSSSTDKLEEYPAIGFPYKRAVKLKIETSKSDEVQVEVSDGKNMYGICIDIDEHTNVATVIPITNNFEGYVIASSPSGIEIGNKLDFNSDGEVIKASNDSQVSIKAIALSNVFTLNLTDDTSKKEQEDYKLYLIKIAIYGNKAVS
ncbi:DUF228 domain-containing protein (plasmid) [Borrelia coriaceae]|uniref:Uncharacterized protein n=1 Tax=Borrelia coriaceae ATCC 43381 TaxID=1408429 RepID=W5SYC8_9SPIR|nr:DUF228 domain-containing protein [Borrelia coriaceae]AHH11860.1 Hypothetical protein BCO_0122602 [Borrelia coriaceae ATCC 43381]UPA16804.1 DUF228 domain-containing protein [Borrelia coriaceae]